MREFDPSVVERARSGDLEAFREIVEAFQEPIYKTVYRLVGRRFARDVEDITQEIFVKIFRAIDQFDPERGVKLSTWIFTFVKNHCFDVLKKRRLETVSLEGSDDFRTGLSSADLTGPSDALANRELGDQIAAAVDKLPEEQRMAFILRQYEGLPYEEIARVMSCSEGTIKSRICRAKEALRYRLQRHVS